LAKEGQLPTSNGTLDAKVIRGPESWTFIYLALGFAISIEGQIISMIATLPWNLIAYLFFGGATFWLFICCGRFQNRLIRLKHSYETKPR
jgi:hypothetical protein